MKKIFFLIIFVSFAFACESDDICDSGTPTTPKVVIQFINHDNQALTKNVTNLKIIATGMTEGIILTPGAVPAANQFLLNNASIVKIPLKIDAETTTYRFILNANATNGSISTDIVQFNYQRTNEFVSRACGYRTFFSFNSSVAVPFTINASANTTAGNWIKDFQIINTIINDETTTHIKIFI